MATTMLNLPETLVTEIFNKVNGHSSVAKLSPHKPLPFNGTKEFVFTMDGEASIVAEGAAKPANSDAVFTPVVIRPYKFIYQTRVSDEFMKANDEARLPYLQAFGEGFSAKIGRALDIASMHGLNPKDSTAISELATKCFDGVITNIVTYVAASADDNLDAAIQLIVANNGVANGIAISPAFGAAMSKIKVNGVKQYPELGWGAQASSINGVPVDINSTVSYVDGEYAYAGDFANAFKWGFADKINFEVIEYGNPDNSEAGDLKGHNQVYLRAEAWVGWGILDGKAFARIETASSGS